LDIEIPDKNQRVEQRHRAHLKHIRQYDSSCEPVSLALITVFKSQPSNRPATRRCNQVIVSQNAKKMAWQDACFA
jgi:hypothetical protein